MMSRVLIVHREAVQRHFLSTFFVHEGCEVAQCATSEDASHFLDVPNSIQAMFVDLDISDQNGSEDSPLFRLVHDAKLAGIPFVGMSARFSQGEGEHMVGGLGGQAFISLPVEPAILRLSLVPILQRDSETDSPRVVLIGHHPEWLAVQTKIFQQQGWSVEECHRPSEVPSRIFEHTPDLFVIHHPVLGDTSSGWLVHLKQHPSNGRVFVAAADHESQLALEQLQYDAQGFKRQTPDQSYFDRLLANAERDDMSVCLSQDDRHVTVEPRGFTEDFQTFIHDFDEIILIIDDEGVIVDINAYGSKILEWPVQDICGHTLRMLEPSGTVEWLASAQGHGQHRQTQLRTQGGMSFEVLISVYPLSGIEGSRFILVAKQLQELISLRAEVVQLREQVQQFQEFEAVGKMAGGIAHDVNNILTAIQGHASLLAHKESINASMERPVEVIRQAVHRGRELTSQLLGAARHGQERRLSSNVHEMIEEVLALLTGERTKGIQIVKDSQARDAWINVNSRRVHQVLLNLLVNACDAISGEGTVRISTVSHQPKDYGDPQHCPLPGRPCLEICVEDSGCGIPHDLQMAVFEPYFSTKPSDKGSGVGLAIVKEIVEAHGGRLTLFSEVDHGTTFHLYFPQGYQAPPSLIHLPTVFEKSLPKVLVVDDESVIAETTVEMLRLFDCEPCIAFSGEQAIDYYREHSSEIDIVVLDLSMRPMTGEECFYALRDINPSVKVMFSSGVEQSFSVQQLCHDKLAGFVQKPFDVEELSLALKQVCSIDPGVAEYTFSDLSATARERI